MRKFLLILSSILATFFLSGCGEEATTIVEDSGSFKDLKVQGNKNYDLVTTDGKNIKFTVDNETLTSKELNGKFVLLNFWATWCAPCLQEMPTLVRLQKEYGDRLQIIGILVEKNKDPKDLADFMTKFKMNFPVTVGEEENYRIAKAFDEVKMFPESFLFAPDGKFIDKYIGEVEASVLEEIFNKK